MTAQPFVLVHRPELRNPQNRITPTILLAITLLGFAAVIILSDKVQNLISKAWNCSLYNFYLDPDGLVWVENKSAWNEAPQKAKVYINDELVATFDVPYLPVGQQADLGTVTVPTGTFNWQIVSTVDCQDSGQQEGRPQACNYAQYPVTPQTHPSLTGNLTKIQKQPLKTHAH